MVERRDGWEREVGVAGLVLEIARDAELPVVVLDPRGKRVEAVNAVFLDTFDWEAQEILGQRYDAFVGDGDRTSFRNLVSIMAYGGSQEPQDVSFIAGEDDEDGVDVSLVGVPNVLEDPTAAVAIICRPRGQAMGKPIGPPKIWKDNGGECLERIPPAKRAKEGRRMNDTSRRLWD